MLLIDSRSHSHIIERAKETNQFSSCIAIIIKCTHNIQLTTIRSDNASLPIIHYEVVITKSLNYNKLCSEAYSCLAPLARHAQATTNGRRCTTERRHHGTSAISYIIQHYFTLKLSILETYNYIFGHFISGFHTHQYMCYCGYAGKE